MFHGAIMHLLLYIILNYRKVSLFIANDLQKIYKFKVTPLTGSLLFCLKDITSSSRVSVHYISRDELKTEHDKCVNESRRAVASQRSVSSKKALNRSSVLRHFTDRGT